MENELTFYSAIVDGDIEYIEEDIRQSTFTNPEGMGKLSESKLQNIRYHFVVIAAMITRYYIRGGME